MGELTGKKLTLIPASIISWEDFKAANPEGTVLSRNTGFSRDYRSQPLLRVRPCRHPALPVRR